MYQGLRNVCFSENLAFFVFLKHPFETRPFALLTTNCALINLLEKKSEHYIFLVSVLAVF